MSTTSNDINAKFSDVIIVGAGLSGISAACHLIERCSDKSFLLLERRGSMGGTWDLFRYPGIRSDSDMFTYGYSFRPWMGDKAIADGQEVLDYIKETAAHFGVMDKIRLEHDVVNANWSDKECRWTLEVTVSDQPETLTYSCRFLALCNGYYNEVNVPDIPGLECYPGEVHHPQHWNPDIDYRDKRVIIIGSGATCVGMAPVVAKKARHVTIVQRSPTYVISKPSVFPTAAALKKGLPACIAVRLSRWFHLLWQMVIVLYCKGFPLFAKKWLTNSARAATGPEFDVDTHFNPRYGPWDQRMCVIPDDDLFKAIRNKQVSVETDEIASFTERGLALRSGKELEADVVITATGFEMQRGGNTALSVNGVPVDISQSYMYRNVQFSDVPNHAYFVGYFAGSYTPKVDATSKYFCRLIKYMDKHGYKKCVAETPLGIEEDKEILELFTPGYVVRSMYKQPKYGKVRPWTPNWNIYADYLSLRFASFDTDELTMR